MAFGDIKVFGKSETLLDYEVAHISKMSAFVWAGNPTISTQAENTRPVCILRLKSVLSSWLYFTEAVSAVYRFITARLEGYLGLYAA